MNTQYSTINTELLVLLVQQVQLSWMHSLLICSPAQLQSPNRVFPWLCTNECFFHDYFLHGCSPAPIISELPVSDSIPPTIAPTAASMSSLVHLKYLTFSLCCFLSSALFLQASCWFLIQLLDVCCHTAFDTFTIRL